MSAPSQAAPVEAGATTPNPVAGSVQPTRERTADKAPKRPKPSGWLSKIATNDKCVIRPTIGNLNVLLEHLPAWRDVFALDTRAGEIRIMRPSPLDYSRPERERVTPRAFTDSDATRLANWFESVADPCFVPGVFATPDKWFAAVVVEAQRHAFDPVATYLEALKWDGVARLATAAHVYFGSLMRPFPLAAFRAWLISAVARTFEPGCKADHAIVLEGPQGIYKSTAFAVLAGPAHFTDELAQIGSKDAALQLGGAWIVELAELDAMNRSDIASTKAFITRTDDRFRVPYGRIVESHPRRCVFGGSTNDSNYLRDSTGNRRFWPIACGTIDIAALRRDRDQLWAEAVALYRAGEPWHLVDDDVQRDAVAEQAAREDDDVWHAHVQRHLVGLEQVTITEVLDGAVRVPIERQGQAEKNRIVRIFQRLGWTRRQVRTGAGRVWVYVAPTGIEG